MAIKLPTSLDVGDTRLLIKEAADNDMLRNQLAYVLATAWGETNYTVKPVREAYWLSEGWRKRNLTRYYPYYGRGYPQLTWDFNYKKADDKLGLGGTLLNNPDRALETDIAVKIAIHGMTEGWFAGKKLSDYITLQSSDFVNARRIINGTDRKHDYAAYAEAYDKLLLEDGYGVEDRDALDSMDAEQLRAVVRTLIVGHEEQEARLAALEARLGVV